MLDSERNKPLNSSSSIGFVCLIVKAEQRQAVECWRESVCSDFGGVLVEDFSVCGIEDLENDITVRHRRGERCIEFAIRRHTLVIQKREGAKEL